MSQAQDIGISGRRLTLGKHKAVDNEHLRKLIIRLDEAGDAEAADTIAWLIWWRDLDKVRQDCANTDPTIDPPPPQPPSQCAAGIEYRVAARNEHLREDLK